MFCQLELLRHSFPPSVRRILDELPESLDETYERILREIKRPNQRHAHRLLQCLVAAVRPLQVKELGEVLAVDFTAEGFPKLNPVWRWEDQEEAVLSACSSFVTIVKDGDSHVAQFSHFSVKEFLTAERLAEPVRDVSCYHIRLGAAHTVLAQACLGVLLRLDDSIDRDSIKGFPLALYAAQYWPTHVRAGEESSRIKEGMECLFDVDKPHVATWLWLYHEDSWGSSSMTTMRPMKPRAVPLYYAARLGFRGLVEHLIAEHPEHVNSKGKAKVTPIHAAAEEGHTDILSLLIDHGADLKAQEASGDTPLHRASWKARLETGHRLLDRGADIDARNRYNNNSLIYATMWGHVEFARMLLERGAVVDARCQHDMTALHWAASRGKTQVARLLLEHGADVNVRDKFGMTPSRLASRYPEIVELLSAYGPRL